MHELDILKQTYQIVLSPVREGFDETQYSRFVRSVYDTLQDETILGILTSPVAEDNPTVLAEQAALADGLGFWLSGMLTIAESYLRAIRSAKLVGLQLARDTLDPKSRWTDIDKRAHLEDRCNRIITLVDLLDRLRVCVLTRVSLCQSLLKHVEADMRQVKIGG